MADKELHELDPGTPTLTDITVMRAPSGIVEAKKTTFQSIKDLLKTSYDALYQAILVSGTNIKTVNGVTILGPGDLTIPALTDGDKGDITVSSSGTVWTIDNGVVTNAKQADMVGGTIKGRDIGTGAPKDLTQTEFTSLVNVATTSLKGAMSSADKTKLDGLTAFKGVKVKHSASQTLSADTLNVLVFDTELYDTSSMHSSSQTYFTAPVTGYYLCNLNIGVDTVTGNYNMFIYSSTDQLMACQTISGVNSSFTDGVSLSGVMKVTTGDTISHGVHLSGTSGNSRSTVASYTTFSASLIGI